LKREFIQFILKSRASLAAEAASPVGWDSADFT